MSQPDHYDLKNKSTDGFIVFDGNPYVELSQIFGTEDEAFIPIGMQRVYFLLDPIRIGVNPSPHEFRIEMRFFGSGRLLRG